MHWGGVKAQVTYERPQEEEDQHAQENSPPFSRLLLPAPLPPPEPAPRTRTTCACVGADRGGPARRAPGASNQDPRVAASGWHAPGPLEADAEV